jgi:quercetin dioxygenase-like cupin family protein
MKKSLAFASLIVAGTVSMATAHDVPETVGLDKPEIRDLMSSALESAEALEVIVSHVALPPNVTLPKHWHPGEEIAYVLQGSVTLILEGESEKEISEGEVGVVPLKQVHSARSGDRGATIIVFRVHEQGQPGRTLVDQ